MARTNNLAFWGPKMQSVTRLRHWCRMRTTPGPQTSTSNWSHSSTLSKRLAYTAASTRTWSPTSDYWSRCTLDCVAYCLCAWRASRTVCSLFSNTNHASCVSNLSPLCQNEEAGASAVAQCRQTRSQTPTLTPTLTQPPSATATPTPKQRHRQPPSQAPSQKKLRQKRRDNRSARRSLPSHRALESSIRSRCADF